MLRSLVGSGGDGALREGGKGRPVHPEPDVRPRRPAPHMPEAMQGLVEHHADREGREEQQNAARVGGKRRIGQAPKRKVRPEGEEGDGGEEGCAPSLRLGWGQYGTARPTRNVGGGGRTGVADVDGRVA